MILKNLAHATWELHDPALCPQFLGHLIIATPSEPFLSVALAGWIQEHGRGDEAKLYFSRTADRLE